MQRFFPRAKLLFDSLGIDFGNQLSLLFLQLAGNFTGQGVDGHSGIQVAVALGQKVRVLGKLGGEFRLLYFLQVLDFGHFELSMFASHHFIPVAAGVLNFASFLKTQLLLHVVKVFCQFQLYIQAQTHFLL